MKQETIFNILSIVLVIAFITVWILSMKQDLEFDVRNTAIMKEVLNK